jgi:hypothetical protein
MIFTKQTARMSTAGRTGRTSTARRCVPMQQSKELPNPKANRLRRTAAQGRKSMRRKVQASLEQVAQASTDQAAQASTEQVAQEQQQENVAETPSPVKSS